MMVKTLGCAAIAAFAACAVLPLAAAPGKGANEAGKVEIVIDSSNAPELADWAQDTLKPELEKWWPIFCEMFPTRGWKPPTRIRVRFKDDIKVPAYATHPNNAITLNHGRFKKTKSLGCVIHELFHIVQQYRKTPSWITEGMADYARYYVYAKDPKACRMDRLASGRRARSKYHTGANFIAFVEEKYPGTAAKLNDVCRRGKYDEARFWPGATGLTLDELEDDWKGRRRTTKAPQVRVMTYNVRYSAGDRKSRDNNWNARRNDFAHMVERENPDVIGFQEVLPDQRKWLEERLCDYVFAGEGRDADRVNGEASPVAFRRDRFEAVTNGTFWLSETPDVPGSKSWGAAYPRICTYAVLRDKSTGKTFSFANTHTDHRSEEAREKGMLLIIERMKDFGKGAPIVFVGDHNCLEFEKPAQAVSRLLKDALHISRNPPEGPWRTCTHWAWRDRETTIAEALKKRPRERSEKGDDKERIDYIYVSPGILVQDYRTIADPRPGTKLYPSDHFPSVATLLFNSK